MDSPIFVEMHSSRSIFGLALLSLAANAYAAPSAAADNTVYVTSIDEFWCALHLFCSDVISYTGCSIIVPRTEHTSVGDSEHPGGMQTYCSPNGRYDDSQGTLPQNFWKKNKVAFQSGTGTNGGRYAQCRLCLPFKKYQSRFVERSLQ